MALLTQVKYVQCCSTQLQCQAQDNGKLTWVTAVQIVAEQRALLDAQHSKAAESPAAQPDTRANAAAAARTERQQTAVQQGGGHTGPERRPSSPQRPAGQHVQAALAADWLSLRRSLSQLATSLPPKQPCSQQVAGSPDRSGQGVVAQFSQMQSKPGHTGRHAAGNIATSGDPADLAVRIAGMEAALAAKEAEVVRMWRMASITHSGDLAYGHSADLMQHHTLHAHPCLPLCPAARTRGYRAGLAG